MSAGSKESPVSAAITSRSKSLTPRGRGTRAKPSRAKQKNARKAHKSAPSSPNEVISVLKELKKHRAKTQGKTSITKTYLYNFDPLKPHFYVVKLGFTGVFFFSYFC